MTWETAKLGDVCSIEKGNIGIMKAIPGEYPLIVLGEERRTHNEFQFDDEAVVIPLVSSTGHGHRSMKRIFFQSGKFSIGSILCAVIPKDKTQLSAEFLYRYLDFNKENELVGRMRGMANVTLPMKEIAEVEIPLPPLGIQKELIEAFRKLESGKDQISTELDHQLALVKELRQAYLREAMQGKLVPQDPTDEPAEILLEKIKAEKEKLVAGKRIKRDKPLPPINPEELPFEIPSNWKWVRFDQLIFDKKNDVRTGPFGSSLHKSEHKAQGVPVWGIESISKDGRFTGKNKIFVTTEKAVELKSFYAKAGDLIISRSGTIGELCMLPAGLELGLISTNLMKISVDKNVISPEFFCYQIKGAPHVRDMLAEFCGGSTRLFLTQSILNKMIFPLPPLAEQERIVAKLEKLMKVCDELEANIKQGITNADRLLQTALKEALSPTMD